MSQKEIQWVKIADNIEELVFNNHHLAEMMIDGKHICIAKYQNNLFACAHKCPHAGGKMVEGFIDAQKNIVCPLHRYRFNLITGMNTSGEGYYLKTYPIKSTEQGIFIGLEKKSFWNLF